MTSPTTTPNGSGRLLTHADEMSLADGQRAQTEDSLPDTLEVRDDSTSILQGTVGGLRRPLLIAVSIVGAVAVAAVVVGALVRRGAD